MNLPFFVIAAMYPSDTLLECKLPSNVKQFYEAFNGKMPAPCFVSFKHRDLKKSICDSPLYAQQAVDVIAGKGRNPT
jgi:hypothetical protein